MYYIMHKQINLTQLAIHLGTHDHPIVKGKCINVMEQVKFLVQDKVFHSMSTTLLAISLVTNKTFIFKHSLNKYGDELVEFLKGDKLHQVMDKFTILCCPNIWNFVVSYKQRLGNRRYVSSIFFFKANNGYDYFYDSCFSGQQFRKVLFFRMFFDGNGGGFDLVKWMQPSGDL